MQELVIDTIDHYRVQQLLARGGMAEVYLAQDIQTGKQVAMKLVHSSAVEYSERFRLEVETLAKLSHEHILPVIDYVLSCAHWKKIRTNASRQYEIFPKPIGRLCGKINMSK